jgi:chromosome segregation ATPase
MIDQEEKSLTELADDLAEAQKRTETLKSLEERIGSEVQAKESAQSALRALELEKKKLGTDIKTHETTIAQLNEQKVDASKYEEQLTALKKQNEQYESAITNLKAIANDASTAATAWEGQYKSILKEKESLGQAAQAMKEAMLKANSNARETVANYQVLKQKCSELLQQNTDLQAKLESKQ